MLYNITSSLYTSLNYQQIVLHICSILAHLRDSLYYMRWAAMHAMDYIDAAITGILSPHVLPMDDLRTILIHIEVADKQFLLLINVPIQDHTQQLEIYEVFNLVIPHRNFSAGYNIESKYLGITYNKTVEISEWQCSTCQRANGQFCSINTPLQPIANPPLCITAIYTKNKVGIEQRCSLQIRNTNSPIPIPIAPNVWILMSAPTVVLPGITIICPEEAPWFIKTQMPIHILCLPPACSATSKHFHLPPCYETHELTINISLNTANLNVINISSSEFKIWQHLEDHWNGTQLHHSVSTPSVPIKQLYKHMISSNGPITPFMSTDESIDDTASIWTLFSHTGIYVMAIGSLIPAKLGIFCCYFFLVLTCQISMLTFMIRFYVTYYCGWWCRGSTHLQMHDKAGQPIIRPPKNHVLCMEWEPTWTESQQKQQTQSKAFPTSGSLDTNSKIQGTW